MKVRIDDFTVVDVSGFRSLTLREVDGKQWLLGELDVFDPPAEDSPAYSGVRLIPIVEAPAEEAACAAIMDFLWDALSADLSCCDLRRTLCEWENRKSTRPREG